MRTLTRTLFRAVGMSCAYNNLATTRELGGRIPRDAFFDVANDQYAVPDPPLCRVGVPCSTSPSFMGFHLCWERSERDGNSDIDMYAQRGAAAAKFCSTGALADLFCVPAGSPCPPALDVVQDDAGRVNIVLIAPTIVRVLGHVNDPNSAVCVPIIAGPGPTSLPWKLYGLVSKPLNRSPPAWLRRLGDACTAALRLVIFADLDVETTAEAVDMWNSGNDVDEANSGNDVNEAGSGNDGDEANSARHKRLLRFLDTVLDMGLTPEEACVLIDALHNPEPGPAWRDEPHDAVV